MTTLRSLLRYLKIKSDDWDMLIVGDGSGTTWEKEMGWGSVLVEKGTFKRPVFHGGMSSGTNNMAEMMAVLHPLMYLVNSKKGVKDGGCRVHVVSDSEYVVNGLAHVSPVWANKLKVNRELWMAIHMTRRKGLIITGHHVRRDTIALQQLGHELANISRKSQLPLVGDSGLNAHDMNPED